MTSTYLLSPDQIVWIMLGLVIKHFICDFLLQNKYQWSNKHIWGHPGGILHSLIHVIGTILVGYIVVPQLLGIFFVISLIEGILHYTIDFSKQNINIAMDWTSNNSEFWILLGVDQLAHYMCYIGILTYLV